MMWVTDVEHDDLLHQRLVSSPAPFPARWMTQVAGLFVMFLLGEWLCVRRELADIPISESVCCAADFLSLRLISGITVAGVECSSQAIQGGGSHVDSGEVPHNEGNCRFVRK